MKKYIFLLLLFITTLSYAQLDLPITFDDPLIDYDLTDFEGNGPSMIVADPTNPSNMVAQVLKSNTAGSSAGTTMGEMGIASPIPFSSGNTSMTVRVWSPDADIQVRLKVEKAGDPTISVETVATSTVAMGWETLVFDFSNEATGTAALNFASTYDKISIFFNFGVEGSVAGNKTYYWDDVQFGDFVGPSLPNLPITFEDTATVDYDLTDFGGNVSMIVTDPTDPTNLVGEAIKTDTAMIWAGTTIGGSGLAGLVPFTASDTKMTVRVWSPDAGIPVRVKVEDASDPTISVETEATTTIAGAWDTLEFDFSNQVDGTAALNLANIYNKISIFFNFGTDGATAGEKTYYWDDMIFLSTVALNQVDLPITFEDTATVDYDLTDFGGNTSMIITDPTDPTNLVGQATKANDAELWAGTTIGGSGLASAIPFTVDDTKMTVRIWSPDAGIPIRVKVEDASDPTISVETETSTTMAGAWETLEFNFSNQVDGTAALNLANTYDLVSIFFNFGTDGMTAGEKTYYWDDMIFLTTVIPPNILDLPITFEDTATIDYALADFAGNASQIITDPTDPTNLVVEVVRSDSALVFAGTTAGDNGLANPVPFTAADTRLSVRVWSPDAGIPIRLKVEDAADPTISVETETNTTVAGEWETLAFNFSNPVSGTAALNLANAYNKISIFFNFGADGMTAGEKTYYFDDIEFLEGGGSLLDQVDLPITFEETATVDYALVDFGGNVSSIVTDPTDATNTVVQAIKTGDALTFAGTTAGNNGLANPIPLTMDETKMKVRVWSPDANIQVRLKVEDATDPTISVETEATTTVAEQWETLEFDFSNEATGTAALNVANTYDKVSIFFNFGTDGATAGEKTYFFDDIEFGARVTVVDIIVNSVEHNTLEAAVIAAELDDDLSGAGPFTVFAPTDEAFDNLPAGVLDNLLADPTGALAEVLLHHVLGAEVYAANLSDGQTATTLQGSEITVSIVGSDVSVDDALVIGADIPADNGVVHVVNAVLMIPTGVDVVNAADYGIEINPNPASDYLTINFTEAELTESVFLSLFDLQGKLVTSAQVTDQVHNLNVQAIPSGMYLLRLDDTNKSYIQKVVIKR